MSKDLIYKGGPVKYFMIDRLAAGFQEKEACELFRSHFEVDYSDSEILVLVNNSETEIEEQRRKLIDKVDKTNLVSMLMRHIHNIDREAGKATETRDLVSLTNTLAGLITTVKPRPKEAPINIEKQVNFIQINTNFLDDLIRDKVIKVIDTAKYTKMFGPDKVIDVKKIPEV